MMLSAKSFRHLALVLAFIAPAALLPAQARLPAQRVIQGKVEAKDGTAVKGAVVYLKDDKTSSVRSAISSDDGTYRFGQLTQATDYELWAAAEGKKSATRSISSFDSKNEFTINLKLDK